MATPLPRPCFANLAHIFQRASQNAKARPRLVNNTTLDALSNARPGLAGGCKQRSSDAREFGCNADDRTSTAKFSVCNYSALPSARRLDLLALSCFFPPVSSRSFFL